LTLGELALNTTDGKLFTKKGDGTVVEIGAGASSYTLPTASTTVLGGVKIDGSTITINSGVISSAASYTLPTASTTVLGGVKVDGTSVTIASGVISVSTAYAGLGANSFTGTQNLQGNLLSRAKIQSYTETVTTPAITANVLTLDLSTANIFAVSLNSAISTLTITNPPASGTGGSFTGIFTADGTARSVSWGSAIKWAGGTAPTITSTSGKRDVYSFFTNDGGTTWLGFTAGQNFERLRLC
jgi:hypothetical protein